METSNSKNSVHRDQLITISDLEAFKSNLILEIKNILQGGSANQEKKWLRSSEVRKMLGVSPGTLQNLRINNLLPFKKVRGIVFYKYEDIEKLLSQK